MMTMTMMICSDGVIYMNEVVKQYVMEHGTVSVAEVQYATGLPYKTVRDTIAEMVQKNMLSAVDALHFAYSDPSAAITEEEKDERRTIIERARHLLKQKTMAYCDVILCCMKHHPNTIGEIKEYCDYRTSMITAVLEWMQEVDIMDGRTYLLTEAETMYLIGVTDELPEG